MTTGAIARATQTVLSGVTVGQYRDGDKLIDIVMRAARDERDAMSDLNNALVPTTSGRVVPLTQLARITLRSEPGVVWRENRDFGVTVQADVADGIQARPWPPSSSPGWTAARRAAGRLPHRSGRRRGGKRQGGGLDRGADAAVPVPDLHPADVADAQLSRALMVFLTGPLGLIGAAGTLLLAARADGFVAQLGITALLGMIIRNSVIRRPDRAGPARRRAGLERHRRIGGAPLPAHRADRGGGRAGHDPAVALGVLGPMAVAIMGGLIVATVLTLLFLPALYAAWFRVRRPEDEGTHASATARGSPAGRRRTGAGAGLKR